MPPHNVSVETDRLAGRPYAAGENSYNKSLVKVLAWLAAYPWALCGTESEIHL
jgi:hypothetical protein